MLFLKQRAADSVHRQNNNFASFYASKAFSQDWGKSRPPINLNNKTILVIGSPGFIGANLVIRLLTTLTSDTVVSLDNMNDYYEVSLKEWRLERINSAAVTSPVKKYVFIKGPISDKALDRFLILAVSL